MSTRKKKSPSPDALFGELRGMLQGAQLTSGQRTQVWSTCARMYKHHPAIYDAVWVPYLQSYASTWRPDLHVVSTLDEIERAARLAPFARFMLKSTHTPQINDNALTEQDFKKFLRSPLLAHVDALDVQHPGALSTILEYASHLPDLRDIRTQNHSPYTVSSLLSTLGRSSHHQTLESIVFEGDAPFPSRTRAEMSGVTAFPSLRVFHIDTLTLGARDIRMLAELKALGGVEDLTLKQVTLRETMLERFIEHDTFSALRSLDLSRMVETSQKATWLVKFLATPACATLEHLNLSWCFRRYTPSALLEALDLPRLHTLDLSHNKVGVTALKKLAASTHLDALRVLDLRDVAVDYSSSTVLANDPFFSRLDALHIHPFQLDHEQAAMLAQSTTLAPGLTRRFAQWRPGLTQWPDHQGAWSASQEKREEQG